MHACCRFLQGRGRGGARFRIVIQMSADNDDSLELQIEPPREEKAKMNALLSSWEFHSSTPEPQELRMYLVASDVYVRNLINRTEQPKHSDHHRKRLGPQCLILQEIEFQWVTENGWTRERDPHRGEITIFFREHRGLTVALQLGELQLTSIDTVQVRFIFYSPTEETNSKTYNLVKQENDPAAYSCTVDDRLMDTYLRPKLAMEFTVKKEVERERKFRGIQNEGNTCYMNSTLQILYFLRPLRKTVLDFQGKNPLMDAIKRVFVQLLDSSSEGASMRPVDASQLLLAYGRFPDPRKQQDIHEFLLGFLDQLETQCLQLKELWLGHGKQELTSRNPEKPYRSSINEEFNELDLLLEDHNSNTLNQLSQALNLLLVEEIMEDKIETDDYGKVEVIKRRTITELPKVIFFNLKRYKYRKDRNRLAKILADFEYPPSINLGFLQGTPTGLQEDYVLFGVAVHRGQAYNSGHYYSFVNTSPDPDRPHWIKFNDSVVQVSSTETALSFTGGKKKVINWSRENQRFIEKQLNSEETAYLLAYIRRDKFADYQTIATPIPKQWLLRQREMKEKKGDRVLDVELLLLDEQTEDIFEEGKTFPLAMDEDEDINQQLARLSLGVLGCRVGSLWKVSRLRKKIKRLTKFVDYQMPPSRIFGYVRGYTAPDFILVVPDKHPTFRGSSLMEERQERWGIVTVAVKEEDGKVRRYSRVLIKQSLEEFKSEEERNLGRSGYFDEEKDRFQYNWTDHCTINFD